MDPLLGPLQFIIFINDIYASIHSDTYHLFVDDLKMFRSLMNVEGCKLLQYDIDTDQTWCLDNGMKIKTGKTEIISFTYKINSINFNYKLCVAPAPSVLNNEKTMHIKRINKLIVVISLITMIVVAEEK
jgi:hypothetical protein